MTQVTSPSFLLVSPASLALVTSIALSMTLGACKKKGEVDQKAPAAAHEARNATAPSGCRDHLRVQVVYPGASPAEVEAGILLAIEESVSTVKGVATVHGFAREGAAQLVIEVEKRPPSQHGMADLDLTRIQQEVRAAIDRIESLPAESERPVVVVEPTSDTFMALILHGELNLLELKVLANQVRDELASRSGIRSVQLLGVPRRELTIRADPTRLVSFGLSGSDVAKAVRAFALKVPYSGMLKTSEMPSIEELGSIVVAAPNSVPVRLSDLATVEDGFAKGARASIGNDLAVLVLVRPTRDIMDKDFSALVSKFAAEPPAPGSRLSASGPIRVSLCKVGAPVVSGQVALLEASVDALSLGRLTPSLTGGDRPALLLEGASLIASEAHGATTTQVIAFPNSGTRPTAQTQSWQSHLAKTPGVSTSVMAPTPNILVVQLEHRDLAVLHQATMVLQENLGTSPASSTSAFPGGEKAELDIQIDREALARFGVTSSDVARTIRAAMHGFVLDRYQDGRDEVDVVLRVGEELSTGQADPSKQILALQLQTPSGAQVPLAQLVQLERKVGPSAIYRRDGRRQTMVRLVLDSDKSESLARTILESKLLPELRAAIPDLQARIGE